MSGDVLPLLWLTFLLMAGTWLLSASSALLLIRAIVAGEADPAARGRRILLTALIPWLAPVTVGAAVLTTAGAKVLGWIADHCPHHGLGHPHLCFSHLPALDLGLVHGTLAGAVALPVVWNLARLIRTEYRATRRLGLLKALAVSRGRLRIVPATTPFALAGGLAEPVVLLSRALLDELSFRERRIVMAHEAAHLRRGDARRTVLLELLLTGHLPVVGRRLREQWLRTLEERADDAVAQRFGVERVVETLLRVARLKPRQPAPGFSVAGASVACRAQRLLDKGSEQGVEAPSFEVVYGLALAALFTAAVTGHHALETLLGLIAGH